MILLALAPAFAENLVAVSVTENTSVYSYNNSVALGVQEASDGDTFTNEAHGLSPSVPSTYTITFTFAPNQGQAMNAVQVWANAGNIYTDAELRTFDLAIDYIDASGNPQTLTMNNINIGDTLDPDDVKTVTLVDGGGNPVRLFGVTEVRMSNLGAAAPTDSIYIREFQGVFETGNDLVTVKSLAFGNPTPNATEMIGYNIKVTNNGTMAAENISLTDLLPAGVTAFNGNGTATDNGTASIGSYNASTGVWTIPSLASGATATLALVGSVNAGTQGSTITNTTTAADNITNDETNTTGDQLSVAVTVDATSKVTQSEPVDIHVHPVCRPNLSYLNDGVIVTELAYCILTPLPPDYQLEIAQSPAPNEYMESLSIWANGGFIYTDGELETFDLYVDYLDASGNPQTFVMTGVNIGDTIDVNDVKTVQLVDGSGNPVKLFNVQQVRLGNLADPGANEVVIREIQANYAPADVELVTVMAITSGSEFPAEGGTVTYEITVTNAGPVASGNVTLTDLLPAGLTATVNNGSATAGSYDAATGVWSIPSLANGASATLTLEGTVDVGTKGTVITNTTTAADGDFNNPATTTGDVLTQQFTVADPQISVQKVADKTVNVPAGDTVTYSYTVTNTGNVPLTNIALSDSHNASGAAPTPSGEVLAGDVTPSGDSTDATADNIWDVLGPGDSVTFTGTYTVTLSDMETLQ